MRLMQCLCHQANRTFDALAKVGDLAEAWLQNEDVLWAFFNNGTQINTLRVRAARFYSHDELYRVQMCHAEQGLTGPKNHATLPCPVSV